MKTKYLEATRADYTDMFRFVESLKFRPETYRTLLQDLFDNTKTETSKLRKKISALVRHGIIAAGLLDGESGTKIFYSFEKSYFILITCKDGIHTHYFCSGVGKGKSPKTIILYNAYILRGNDWEYLSNVSVLKTCVSRWF